MTRLYFLVLLTALIGCKVIKLPREQLSQYEYDKQYKFIANRLEIKLGNPLYCPLRVWVKSTDSTLKASLEAINPIVLPPKSDTLLSFKNLKVENELIQFASRLGDLNKEVIIDSVSLPFPQGKPYSLIQGQNSLPTHNTDWSNFALDFSLSIGDTICAATSGYVVGMIEAYKFGGPDKKWKPFGNFITIYDPVSRLFTQYAHLKHLGSLVEVGDKVKLGSPIGLAGMTGQTNIEHLHFNCLAPENSADGLKSIFVPKIGKYKSDELYRGQTVVKE